MESWHLARGFRYAGIHCGIRPDPERLDLALIFSERPCMAAGVFTQNRVCAAPVRVCRERLPSAEARGIVICSGNANACTGRRGLEDAWRMTERTAKALGCRAEQILVCSTGVIGRPLPMPVIVDGIDKAARSLKSDAGALDRAAHAILTTDTRIKVSTRALSLGNPGEDRAEVRLTGFAKGAAMIGPNMATLLAFLVTDACVARDDLAGMVPRAAAQTFNCVSVEGHTSTNDSLLFMANGAVGNGQPLQGADLTRFEGAAISVCADLARAIAADAEGASHLVTIQVEGTRTDVEAGKIAKAVAESALVKAAIFGADPNWGRIVSAAGYAGVMFDETDLSLWLGDFLLYDKGTPLPFDTATVSAFMKNNRELTMRLLFTLGAGRSTHYTCDLTYEYVRLNAEYTT